MAKRTVAEVGKDGGLATFKKYGRDHYSKIAQAKWKAYRKHKKAEEREQE